MHPIWLRKTVTLGTGSDYEFYIKKDGAEIYRGHAYKRPGASSVEIVLNDICRDYLAALPASGSVVGAPYTATPTPFVATFATYLADNTIKDTTTFIMDWSYDETRAALLGSDPTAVVLEDPIVPEWSDDLPVLVTSPVARGYSDGEDSVVSAKPAVFTFTPAGVVGALVLEDVDTGDERTFPLRHFCGEWYALVYLNAFGGWDQLVCDGRTMVSRSYDRRTIIREADNATTGISAARRAVHTYGISEADRWQLSTPFLTDDQSARMHHLLGSREVWLVSSADTAAWLPVTVETDTVDVKTHANQEGGMVAYAFTVKLAEDRQR